MPDTWYLAPGQPLALVAVLVLRVALLVVLRVVLRVVVLRALRVVLRALRVVLWVVLRAAPLALGVLLVHRRLRHPLLRA
jgi:hypothetical protein